MSTLTFETWFRTRHPEIPLPGALATLKLAAEGGTVPFLARYRKEQTGNLDEVAIQRVLDSRERWDAVVDRQRFVVEQIDKQKKLTPELRERILGTFDADALEDLYLPFKQKRKSKATAAREAGIEPLADWIWNCGHGTEKPQEGQTLELWGFTFRNEEKGYADLEAVVQGAQDILTERLAETRELRQLVRQATFEKGFVRTAKAEGAKPSSKFERYFDYGEPIRSLLKPEASHRYLAARRGWIEKELTLAVAGPPDDAEHEQRLLGAFEAAACTVPDSPGAAVLLRAARVALKAHVLPSIEGEVHRALKEVADAVAIEVFAENLRRLLLASPFGSKAVIGVDPGVRTGSKVAVVDDSGKYLANHVFHLHTEEQKATARKLLAEILAAVPVRAIAVGNGTGSREAEAFLREAVKEAGQAVPVVLVSEAGASVYSASEAAREEFPALDLTVRGAISIARRLQDPLAELVKIDPRSIGVGQYQHDVSAGALKRSLDQVVDTCVNQVGVNLNTASCHLLAHVAGIGPALARGIVEHRSGEGLYRSRQQLLDVPRFSKKAFEQAAGFLRIPGGDNPLDNTGVHPERYATLEGLAARLGKPVSDLLGPGVELIRSATELREEVGAFTFEDMVRELEKPGRDPREAFVPFAYREDVHGLADLKPGMRCPGIVTNVTNFGAFVDIGVHQDGLVHVSQLSDRFVKDPREVVHPGLHVEVRVLEVNLEKQQIALAIRSEGARRPPEARRPRPKPSQDAAGEGAPKAARPPRPPRPRRPQPKPERRPEASPAAAPPADGAARPAAEAPPPPATPPAASARPPRPPAGPRPGPGQGPRPPRDGRPGRPPFGDRDRRDRDDRGRGPRRDHRDESGPIDRPRPDLGSNRGAHVPLNNPFAVLADLKKNLKK